MEPDPRITCVVVGDKFSTEGVVIVEVSGALERRLKEEERQAEEGKNRERANIAVDFIALLIFLFSRLSSNLIPQFAIAVLHSNLWPGNDSLLVATKRLDSIGRSVR